MPRTLRFWLCLAALLIGGGGVQAQDSTEVELGFDDLETEAPAPAAAVASWVDRIHISGRFDLNLEYENLAGTDYGGAATGRFRNYHRFLFLNVTPTDKLTLDAEVLDLSYYEIKYALGGNYALRFGKIWVPFGATPFHHYYGGLQGDPFQGLFLPNVWAEFGATIGGTVRNGERVRIETDAYVIRGFEGTLGSVLALSAGGSDDTFAVGGRTKVGLGSKIAAWGSAQFNRFGAGDAGRVLLWGGDVLFDFGLVNLPVLKNLRLRAAFARAEIRDETLVRPEDNTAGWYYRYGDYAELTYRGFGVVMPRLRYGTVIDFDDQVTGNDSHSWEAAVLARLDRNLSALLQYQFRFEAVNEVDNDLLRLQLVFEF